MNFANILLPNFGSGKTSRFATTRLLGIALTSMLIQVDPEYPSSDYRKSGLTKTYFIEVEESKSDTHFL